MTALEWPPPGLTDLRGRFRSLTRLAATSSAIILAASMGFAAYVPDEFWFSGGSTAQLFFIWGTAGVLVMLAASAYAWRDIARATFAVRQGYTWLTVAETMADHIGDTGALTAGTGVFSAVTPQLRGAMRVSRILSSLALLGAAALPVPMIVFVGWIGVDVPSSPLLLLAIVLAPSFALMAVGALVNRVEYFAFRESRRGHEDELAQRDARRTVVEPWYAALDAARVGQQPGRGWTGGALLGRAINSVACAALALIVASLVPLWIVSMSAPAVFSWQGMRNYTNSSTRLRQYAPLRKLAPAADAAISPAQAGEAMHALAMRGAPSQPSFVRRPSVTLPSFPLPPDSLLPNMRGRSFFFATTQAFPAARAGFNAKQRAFFTALAASPGAELFHTAARAPRADIAGARFATPFDNTVSPFSIPGDPSIFTFDTLAWAHFGRAALFLADGKPNEAEADIGDVIAVGFRLAEDGVSLSDESEGLYMIQVGANALRSLYSSDKTNAAAAAKAAWLDSTLRTTPPIPGSAMPLASAVSWTLNPTRDKVIRALTDTIFPRSRRIGLVRAAGVLACTNMRELLFGPGRDLRDALSAARKELVRSPAEGALFDLNAHAAEREYHAKRGSETFSLDQELLLRSARIAGFVLRNKRIVNCAELAVGARQIGG